MNPVPVGSQSSNRIRLAMAVSPGDLDLSLELGARNRALGRARRRGGQFACADQRGGGARDTGWRKPARQRSEIRIRTAATPELGASPIPPLPP